MHINYSRLIQNVRLNDSIFFHFISRTLVDIDRGNYHEGIGDAFLLQAREPISLEPFLLIKFRMHIRLIVFENGI